MDEKPSQPPAARPARVASLLLAALLAATLLAQATPGGATTDATSAPAGAANGPAPIQELAGVNTHLVWLNEQTATARLTELADRGVRHVREQFPWDHTERAQGQWDWSRTDALMAASSRSGVEVLALLAYTPPWASSGPGGNAHFPPRSDAAFATFARRVVERYGPAGSFWASRPDLRPEPVRAVELWNEPWGFWNWRSGVDPADYARLARAGATAVHAAHPDVQVLIAGDLLQNREDGAIVGWIDNVLAADPGLGALIDGYSVHPYPDDAGPLVERPDGRWDYGRVELIRQITVERGAAHPIWITEVGWSTANASATVTEQEQALYSRQALLRAANEWPWVERVYLYSGDRDSGAADDREGHFGMFRADGSPKPALAELEQVLEGTSPFIDVPTTHPFHDEVAWLSSSGITTGYQDGTFRPGAALTRGAMAAYLHRMAGSPSTAGGSAFDDVPTTHPFHDEVAWLSSSGITTGYDDGTFRPGAPLTRAAMAAYLHRQAGSPAVGGSASFGDVPASHPFHAEVVWLSEAGITTGYQDGTFRPGAPLTRAAMAAYLHRMAG